jgi:hypothetical protein
LTSKPVATVFSSLILKSVTTVSPGLTSKLVAGFLFWVSNWQQRFGDLNIKITAAVSWFGSQNQAGYGLLVAL